jgi:hypothetical protein
VTHPLPPQLSPTPNHFRGRLRRAGWTVRAAYSRWVGAWMVYAARGAGTLTARGRSEAEALRHACELAAAMGMLGEGPGDVLRLVPGDL